LILLLTIAVSYVCRLLVISNYSQFNEIWLQLRLPLVKNLATQLLVIIIAVTEEFN